MLKLTNTQKQITTALGLMPKEIEPAELEALVCSLVSAYVGFEETAKFLLHMHLKVKEIQDGLMEQAEKETKH